MVRPRNQERRRRLRAGACQYLLRVGVSAADLGEMAAELGTSPRMLIHYFGSKDRLIDEGVGEAREQQRSLFREWLGVRKAQTLPGLLRTLWELMQAPQARPYLRLFSEVFTLAVQQPGRFRDFSTDAAVYDWLPGLEEALREGGVDDDEARAVATLVLAVERGLLLDVLGTGDHERVKAAHDALLRLLEAPSPKR
jgi:AcrR family transcriptional regulator